MSPPPHPGHCRELCETLSSLRLPFHTELSTPGFGSCSVLTLNSLEQYAHGPESDGAHVPHFSSSPSTPTQPRHQGCPGWG